MSTKTCLIPQTICLLLLTLVLQPVCAQDYILKNVHVLTMDDPNILRSKYIWVSDGKIKAISDKTDTSPPNAIVIDGKGTYIFPGLAEMHSHIPTTDTDDFSYVVREVLWIYSRR